MNETRRLRIAFLIDRWSPGRGGAERALATFAAWLETRGHEVLALGLEGPAPGESAPGLFVPVTTHGWTRGKRERRLAEALLSTAAGMGCDVTIGTRHLPRVDFYWPHGGAHAATLRALGKRVRGRHRAFLELERKALADGGARRVVCVSELVRQEILDFYPTSARRLRLIPNGVDLERFRPAAREASRAALLALTGWPAEDPILTFTGRNAKLKGLERLFQALGTLAGRPWRLLVAGPEDARRWGRRARKAGLDPERLHIAAQLDPLMIAAGGDLAILPSRRDTCGLVVLEALAAGTPVLISEAVGAKEVLRDPLQGSVFGKKVKPRELAALIEAQLLRNRVQEPDRAVIASAVADRDLSTWLGALERELLDVARVPGLG